MLKHFSDVDLSVKSVDTATSPMWQRCLNKLSEYLSAQEQQMWIMPVQPEESEHDLKLYCPNQHVLSFVQQSALPHLSLISQAVGKTISPVIGSRHTTVSPAAGIEQGPIRTQQPKQKSNLNKAFTFGGFVQGKANQIAYASARQVAEQPGMSYNPLVIYGGVGLGKTHLMHAIAHDYLAREQDIVVRYIHAERFVSQMIRALQTNTMDRFKTDLQSVNLLLIDDIQFFVNKERSQEVLFHTINELIDNNRQIVVTCDRFPKELDGMEDRLKSRFSWGLTVGVDPPDLETRVAILCSKAKLSQVKLPDEVAFFIAENVTGNVRELEGALKRVIANAFFSQEVITLEFAKQALRDMLHVQARLHTVESIQKAVARYYQIKISDLTGHSRQRSVARPRQFAMYLAKQLTERSLPEIGQSFNRDHTTVLHAVRRVQALIEERVDLKQDLDEISQALA